MQYVIKAAGFAFIGTIGSCEFQRSNVWSAFDDIVGEMEQSV